MTDEIWMWRLRASLAARRMMQRNQRHAMRDYVRAVLAKIRAARQAARPPAGLVLSHAVGRAIATAGYIGSYGGDS